MKKSFWDTTVGKIAVSLGKIALGMIIKNQKGIKGTDNVKRIDDIIDNTK